MSDTPRTDSYHDITLSVMDADILREGWYKFAGQLERSQTATWAERELAEIVRIVQPAANEDTVDRAMILSAIRRLIEASPDEYLNLMRRAANE